MMEASQKGDRAVMDGSMVGSHFQIMRELNPPLRMLVNRKVAEVRWVLDHLVLLSFVILRDLLGEEQLSEKGLEDTAKLLPDDLRKVFYARKFRHLANDYYWNVVYPVAKPSPELKKILERPGITVISSPPRPERPIGDEDERVQLRQTTYSEKPMNPVFFSCEFADSSYIELFGKYWRRTIRLIPALQASGPIRKESAWILDSFLSGDYVAHVLFQDATDEVFRRWFEISLGSRSKVEMMNPISWPKYSESDADSAVKQYRLLQYSLAPDEKDAARRSGTEALMMEQLTFGSLSYIQHGRADVGVRLFSGALKSWSFAGEDTRADCTHNLGMSLFLKGEFLAAGNATEPLMEYWRKSRNMARLVTDGAIAALAPPQKKFPRLPELLADLEPVELQEKVRVLLELSDLAAFRGNHEAEELCLSNGLRASAHDNHVEEYAVHFTKRIGQLHSGYATQRVASKGDEIPGNCFSEREMNGTFLSFCGGFPHLH